MTNRMCSVDGCSSAVAKREWCGKHYLRWYNHGDAGYEPVHYMTCDVDGCANPPRSGRTPLCEMHYYRVRRHGDPSIVIDTRRDAVRYRAAHSRIAIDRGKANSYQCVDCGVRAEHWSYDHGDPDELVSISGQPYSLDTSRYEPRCRRCHAMFDGVGANQYTCA